MQLPPHCAGGNQQGRRHPILPPRRLWSLLVFQGREKPGGEARVLCPQRLSIHSRAHGFENLFEQMPTSQAQLEKSNLTAVVQTNVKRCTPFLDRPDRGSDGSQSTSPRCVSAEPYQTLLPQQAIPEHAFDFVAAVQNLCRHIEMQYQLSQCGDKEPRPVDFRQDIKKKNDGHHRIRHQKQKTSHKSFQRGVPRGQKAHTHRCARADRVG